MKITVLIPHWKNGMATAHAVSKVIQNSGKHEVKIIVIDNSTGDRSINHILLTDLSKHCMVLHYPPGRLQSHGIAFDWALEAGHVETEYFITLESDSYPADIPWPDHTWLDYYEDLIKKEHPALAGSRLMLSGGEYIHPCGALYEKSAWDAVLKYVTTLNSHYRYFPNMMMKEGFACHTMVRASNFGSVSTKISMTIEDSKLELAGDYLHQPIEHWMKLAADYLPCSGPFHCGMGVMQESIKTYGERNLETGIADILTKDPLYYDDVILRIGYEPGQMLSYFLLACGAKVMAMDTIVKWLPGREGRNQEYTRMENGLIHLWGISSFHGAKAGEEDPDLQRVIDFKRQQMDELYNKLPAGHKL